MWREQLRGSRQFLLRHRRVPARDLRGGSSCAWRRSLRHQRQPPGTLVQHQRASAGNHGLLDGVVNVWISQPTPRGVGTLKQIDPVHHLHVFTTLELSEGGQRQEKKEEEA